MAGFLKPTSLLLGAALASAQLFTFDLTPQPKGNLTGAIFNSFGSSHASTTLRATWRKSFSATQADIPFKRVRFHGILDDDMSTFLNGQANGALVFDTLDFLVASGIAPTVELSFMPEGLASDPSKTVFHYKGGISPYANASAYATFITQLVRLFVDRYGIATVRSWRMEVWNEPNCGFFYEGNCCGPACGNQSAYFDLYETTARAVKVVDAGIPVGGPATAQLAWIPEFLAFCAASGAPVDFVSSHLYPTDPQIDQGRNGFSDAVRTAAALASASGLPFLLTEFNAGLGNEGGVAPLDSSYAGAFLLHAHLAAQAVPNLESMSYWTFTDFGFEEQGVDPLPWHPGATKFGVATMYGVPKPAYRALEMIAGQATAPGATAAVVSVTGGGTVLLNTADAVIGATAGTVDVCGTTAPPSAAAAAAGASLTVTVLLANFNVSSAAPPAPATVTLAFTAPAATAWPATATLELVDAAHSNPMAVWLAAGSPLYPPASEIAAELAASALAPQQVALHPVAHTVDVTLQPYAFARLTFSLA